MKDIEEGNAKNYYIEISSRSNGVVCKLDDVVVASSLVDAFTKASTLVKSLDEASGREGLFNVVEVSYESTKNCI